MSAIEPTCALMGLSPEKFSKEEFLIIESEIFIHLCNELIEHYRNHYKNYFSILKYTLEMENIVLQNNLARFVTIDLVSAGEYDLAGIAIYTDTPEEIVQEIIDGRNERPSAKFLLRIIELHRSVRRELYTSIMKKYFIIIPHQ